MVATAAVVVAAVVAAAAVAAVAVAVAAAAAARKCKNFSAHGGSLRGLDPSEGAL